MRNGLIRDAKEHRHFKKLFYGYHIAYTSKDHALHFGGGKMLYGSSLRWLMRLRAIVMGNGKMSTKGVRRRG